MKARKNKSSRVDWVRAGDIEQRIKYLVSALRLEWIDTQRVHAFRSHNSSARAYARIWGFGRIWQIALREPACYCIEVLSEQFDHLKEYERDKILLHEIAHIPKNFSGSLLPHTKRGKGNFHDKLELMVRAYKKL